MGEMDRCSNHASIMDIDEISKLLEPLGSDPHFRNSMLQCWYYALIL